MKKILFAVAAMAMVFATSCKKESINEPEVLREPQANEFLATVNGAAQQNAPAKDGNSTMATFDGLTKVMWQDGDAINVNGTTFTCNAVVTTGQTRAYFENESASPFHASHYHAFYSSTLSSMSILQSDSTKVSGVLSATQTYDPQRMAANLPMYAYSTDHWLDFYNICAAVKIFVPCTADSIVVTNSSTAMNGAFDVTSNIAVMKNTSSVTDAEKKIKITKTSGTFVPGDSLYFAIPQGSYSDFTITFYNGATAVYTTGASSKAFSVTANQIYRIRSFKHNGILPGYFTVKQNSVTDPTKKVQFTTGNLWYDGSAYHLEDKQTDYQTSYSASHVSHFYYCTQIAAATSDLVSSSAVNTSLFCNEANSLTIGGVSGLYCLTKDEWNCLINNRANAANLKKEKVTIKVSSTESVLCVAIAPDDFAGTLAANYTLGEANAMGLLLLPYAGYRMKDSSYPYGSSTNSYVYDGLSGRARIKTGGTSGEDYNRGRMIRYWGTGSSCSILYTDELQIKVTTLQTNTSSAYDIARTIRLAKTAWTKTPQ